MMVRVFVSPENRALVRRFVHATRYEPVAIDPKKGVLAFDVPYRRVEAMLDRLAKSGLGRFLAHMGRIKDRE